MGGVDQLLELVEAGVGITEHKTRSYPLAVYYGEDDLPEVTTSKVYLVTHMHLCRAVMLAHRCIQVRHHASAAALDQVMQWDCIRCLQCFSGSSKSTLWSKQQCYGL